MLPTDAPTTAAAAPPEAAPDDRREHRAVAAWRRLRPRRVEPDRIDMLKLEENKSAVYRLAGVGAGGSSVIAKRTVRSKAAIERVVYEEMLPRVPVQRVRYYGFVDEPEAEASWLFVEDAGGSRYSAKRSEHRVLAARWLGTLHTAAIGIVEGHGLRDRGAGHYRERLRAGRDAIRRHLANRALGADEGPVLREIIDRCDRIEDSWAALERYCDGMPTTLVHADFGVDNARVRADRAEPALLVFDWGTAGQGPPTVDLAQRTGRSLSPDLATYWSVVREAWPWLDPRDIRRLAEVGAVFRALACIHWASWGLADDGTWVHASMGLLRGYRARLAEAMPALELGG